MRSEFQKRMDKILFDSSIDRLDMHEHLFEDNAASTGESVSGTPPMSEAIDAIRQHMSHQSAIGNAYLVCPPAFLNQITPIEMPTFESPYNGGIKFRMFNDYGIKVVPSSMLNRRAILACDIGGESVPVPKVDWKPAVEHQRPSALIWCVVVAFLFWLLCAASSLL